MRIKKSIPARRKSLELDITAVILVQEIKQDIGVVEHGKVN
jgi:hypothetical protein